MCQNNAQGEKLSFYFIFMNLFTDSYHTTNIWPNFEMKWKLKYSWKASADLNENFETVFRALDFDCYIVMFW